MISSRKNLPFNSSRPTFMSLRLSSPQQRVYDHQMMAIQYSVANSPHTVHAICLAPLSLTNTGQQSTKSANIKRQLLDVIDIFNKSDMDIMVIHQPHMQAFIHQYIAKVYPALSIKQLPLTSSLTGRVWLIYKEGIISAINPIMHNMADNYLYGVDLAKKLAIQLSLGIGPQSGMNLLAAIHLQSLFRQSLKVVTLFPDNYLQHRFTNTDHNSNAQLHYHYHHQITFLGYTSIDRM